MIIVSLPQPLLFSEGLFHNLRVAAPGHVDESRRFGIPDEPDLGQLEGHRAQAVTDRLICVPVHALEEHEQKFPVDGEDLHGMIGDGAANGDIGITCQVKDDAD